VRRQLPAIAQRLSATLAKLQRPHEEEEKYVSARGWWEALTRRCQGEGLELRLEHCRGDARVPRTLFDSVADNLVRNALAKRAGQAEVKVVVALSADSHIALRVSDSGSAVPQELSRRLLRGPVESATGLGIGLYQAARQAEGAGYVLSLEANRDGEVTFALRGPAH
jgi:C4-dicarboxylate-specific signal transduction histidine kinase